MRGMGEAAMRKTLLACVLVVASGAASPQGADVGLVSMVSGDVAYVPLAGASGRVKAFMRLRDGDKVELPPGAHVRVVLFGAARQERWEGPARFRAAQGASVPLSGKLAEVTNLPAGVPQRIARVPELIQNARLGGIQMRGGPPPAARVTAEEKAALSDARTQHDAMRNALLPDDITAELFLFATLEELRRDPGTRPAEEEMLRNQLVQEMLRKQPDNQDVKALAARLQIRPSRP
jgi:hypothetical protein